MNSNFFQFLAIIVYILFCNCEAQANCNTEHCVCSSVSIFQLFGESESNEENEIEQVFVSDTTKLPNAPLPMDDVLQFRRQSHTGGHKDHKGPEFVDLWPNGRIPLRMNNSFSRQIRRTKYLKDNINDVVRFLKKKTCIKIEREEDFDQDFIEFTNQYGGCFVEKIGNSGGGQIINLGDRHCWNKGAILHEIMHKLGFVHEHQRNDRDNYVRVFMNNTDDQLQYKTAHQLNLVMQFTGQYDIDSVMHYPSHTNGKEMIQCIANDIHCSWRMGRRHSPTANDVEKINELYECFFGVPQVTIAEGARIEVKPGQPIQLTCNVAAGHLSPKLIWYRDDKQIENGLLFKANKTIVQIVHAIESAMYVCSAETENNQTTTAAINVVVLGPGSPPLSIETVVKNETIKLSWSEPKYPNGPVLSYEVHYTINKSLPMNEWSKVTVGYELRTTDIYFNQTSTYYYLKMRAVNYNGPGVMSDTLLVAVLGSITKTFENPLGREGPFEKMVVNQRSTGHVYIGGVNRLYDLIPTLKERISVITGPELDHPNCPTRWRPCDKGRELTDSYTKSLAIDSKRSKLIECTSLFRGRCRTRNLYDITTSKSPEDSSQFIAANDRISSTVVFVASGPPDPVDNEVLYVGSTFADNGPFRDEVPDVVTLSLDDARLFAVVHRDIKGQTSIKMSNSYRRTYKIRYVAGFSAGNFSYFVTTQPRSLTEISLHHSRLIRLCHRDKYYHSYTEVPLQCMKGNNDYNLVQGAYVAKAGYDLAHNFGIRADDLVLFAVFSKAQGTQEQKTPSRFSALCVFSIKSIEAKFLENIEECNKGTVLKGLERFDNGRICLKTQFPESYDVTCGIEVNQPIGGSMSVKGTSVITTSQAQYTAVVAKDLPANCTVVFIGTKEGRLIKGVVETATKGYQYQTIQVDPGRPVLSDMDLDMSGHFIFVLTQERVIKVKTHECQLKDTCSECLEAKDPYCGWCLIDNKCSVHSECNDKSSMHWISYKDSRCPKISEDTL